MNRPRPSVLQLFDPLTTRDAHSPDSDKENTLPDFDFFPQTWVQHPSPVRLTRRLVEVGDVTVDAAEDNENAAGEEEDDENDTVGIHSLRKAAAGEMAVSNAATDDYAFASVMDAVTASGGTLDEAPWW
ncbi:hypothetical protein C8F04DRAFT_1279343 [Mycena alexandri]|uniref:Uncharacterized protein n=1 Tax=Mycena alexandri TaxID=1745969 RepID=A0AAD6RZ02_9AGAR|nr:hypothetical protein C8F04DRAFT_1279343 [Mycena alexandri]